MDKQFWIKRWQENDIGFHQERVNDYLQSWWGQLSVQQGECVFVPLCGKSKDMLWLVEQGYKVIGVEVSSLALNDFFAENNLSPKLSEESGFRCYEVERLKIYNGDFFSLTAEHLKNVAAVFDRASLVALPPAMREQYSEHLVNILPDKTKTLLLAIEYDQQEMQGPPFAVMEEEVQQLFAEKFKIERLDENDMLEENPHFRERGLTWMNEKVYRINF